MLVFSLSLPLSLLILLEGKFLLAAPPPLQSFSRALLFTSTLITLFKILSEHITKNEHARTVDVRNKRRVDSTLRPPLSQNTRYLAPPAQAALAWGSPPPHRPPHAFQRPLEDNKRVDFV